MSIESPSANNEHTHVKLIFNPVAGAADASPIQLMDVINEMQSRDFMPEAYLVGPDCKLDLVVQDALERGIRMFTVCGGDGTIECVTEALIKTDATLGIIPTGTRNNIALSLGIPEDIPTAVSLLRTGRHITMDVGFAVCGEQSRFFLETCSVGLLSALFPAADDIQHGNLSRIGDFLSTLISFPSADMRLILDTHREIVTRGHVVLVGNLPYVGPHYQIAPEDSFDDGLLDLLVFPDLSKLDLLSNVTQITGGWLDDPRIRRYHVQRVEIDTDPHMPVMADGFSLGKGPLSICVKHHALSVIAGEPAQPSKAIKDSMESITEPLADTNITIEA